MADGGVESRNWQGPIPIVLEEKPVDQKALEIPSTLVELSYLHLLRRDEDSSSFKAPKDRWI